MIETKLKKRRLNEDVALLIAVFGTSSSGRVVYDKFDELISEQQSISRILWAYTSEIIREKQGMPGVLEAMAQLEAEGYRKVIVQPLHIFPATEYTILSETCRSFPGVRVFMGETLMHRWKYVLQVMEVIEQDFISPLEGVNVIVGHGTPLCADPANAIYLNIHQYLKTVYSNLYFTTLDGVPNIEMLLEEIKRSKDLIFENTGNANPKIRLIPLIYVAGMHVQEDLLAEEDSLKSKLESMGFQVEYPIVNYKGITYPKTLGFYDDILQQFKLRAERAIELTKYY